MNLATVCYMPPPGRFNVDSFHSNITSYNTKYPIYFYSDVPGRGVDNLIANPEVVRNPRRPWTTNNLVFLFGLKLAIDAKLDFMLYVESDSRVRGDYWDGKLFDEMFAQCKEPLIYGTPVCYNVTAQGLDAANKTMELACKYREMSGFPMSFFGKWPGAGDRYCCYVNGSLGIYHVPTMAQIFKGFEQDIGRHAASVSAWDLVIAHGLWDMLKISLFDHFALSSCSLSLYGNDLMNEQQRMALLNSGKVCAVHQVKSDAMPI